MTSDISVGTVSTTGTTNRITGTISNLDTDALVQNAVDANNADAVTIDNRIAENQAEIDAYQEFFGLANALQTSLNALKSDTSTTESTNAFDQRTANINSTNGDAAGLLDISINEGAPEGTYQIVVEQKAEAFSVGSQTYSTRDVAIGHVGDFNIGLDGFTSANVVVDALDSLDDIAAKINADTATSGVQASILQTGETQFQLIISGTQENTSMTATTNSGNALQLLDVVDVSDNFVTGQIIQVPQNSRITLDGTTITRSDNNYDNLITGIEFDIRAADATSTITIDVNNDVSAAKNQIQGFIDSYNAFRDFVIQNQEVNSDGTLGENATLFGDNLLSTMSNNVFNLLNTFKSDNGNVTNLADLGITFDDNNRLFLSNESTLDNALLSDFTDVQNFFTTNYTISDPNLRAIANTNTQSSLDFNLSITMNPDGTIASASGAGTTFDIQGTSIVGPAGSIYEGLTLAYVGTTSTTISVSIQAGIADQIFNSIEGFTSPVNGLIQAEIDTLTANNEDLSEEAEEIRARGEEIREREIQRYSDMEAALARAETLQRTLAALLGTDDNN